MSWGGGGGKLCRPCSCCLSGLTFAPGLCCGACPSYPVAVVGIPLVLFLFISFVFIYARPITALYSRVYVLRTFDETSDVVSYGTVPRTFVQDTVVCWLVATTACSCGFRTIDIVWRGPVFLVPGFLRHPIPEGLVVVLTVLDGFSPPSFFRTVLLTFRTLTCDLWSYNTPPVA